ncbi:MAG: hypothetical protein ILO43_05960 [Clostridia bacterium]|nr:hypothetical protein [Clostridia bacterium]MBP5460189.1 hypothetical protein [Clostridia bacterium]
MSATPIRKDAYAFCHGMLGFGEDEKIYDLLPYFGGTVGSFTKALEKQGYEAHALSFSSVGSAWDRACEIYASLTGTQVDYGVAHAKKYGHDRFGKVYTEAKLPNWGKPAEDGDIQRLHIIGHSFGGATVRMFSHLLAFGSEEERAATPENELSPLFKGGQGDLLKSVTTIAGPHEGTVVIDAIGIQRPMLAALSFYGLGAILGNTPFRKLYDMQLMQWNLTSDRDGKAEPLNMLRFDRMKKLWSACDDVYYDLTLKGAKELNEFLETNRDAYYFSISTDSSERKENGYYKQIRSSFPLFWYTGWFIGHCKHDPSLDIDIGEWWRASDGASCTNSALHPLDEEWQDFDPAKDTPKKGMWNVMPVMRRDHGGCVGLGIEGFINPEPLRKYYDDYFAMLRDLK